MNMLSFLHKLTLVSLTWFLLTIMFLGQATAGQFGTPKDEEGTRIFKPIEHPTYSGHFRLAGQKGTLIGRMHDKTPWDHMDYAGKHLNPIVGKIEIEVNERTNIGQVHAEFVDGVDQYRIVFTRFAGVAPYQDGGLATRVYEHGDSGNGDSLYPKTWLYLAGWGKADVFKNGHLLFQDYAAHFMVMERSRDPNTHEVPYPLKRSLPGGETDPAGIEIDLWVRSSESNTENFPPFETFIHLFWEEVTWK
ncbi:MAG: hypothetical protein H0X47_11915 [Nitrospirales bacterium]|nr:hypothetical protein [Nitrospirales bacterium]